MATNDIQLEQVVFNTLSQEKYNELKENGQLNPNEIYLVPDTESVDVPTKVSDLVNDSGYITETELTGKGYLTSVPNEYITETELTGKGYLTSHQDISGKADKSTTYTKSEVDTLLSPTATTEYVDTEVNKKANKATTIAGYNITDAYTKTEVDAKVSSVYRFIGNVATETDLPKSNNVIGDVYNVESTGDNYAWNGAIWDKLSGTVDLTPYLTKDEAASTYALANDIEVSLSSKADSLTTYTKEEVDVMLESVKTSVIYWD
jgi:hypothetical protein